MTKEQEIWALRVYGERKDEVHVTLMPKGVRILDTPIDINDDHMQTACIHVELKSNGDAQGSVDLSKVLVEQRPSRTWLRFGKRRGTRATEERAMRMRELTVPLLNAAGKTIDSPKLRFELTPISREEKESIAETGTWRVLLTTGRCTYRDDTPIRALAFSATLGGQTQSLDRQVTLENQQSPGQRPAKTSSPTKEYLHGKEETSVFSVKQMFRFNGRWVASEVLRVNVDIHTQSDEHANENALANSVHHASCEIALTSSKFAAELRLGDSQHFANLKDYGVQVYVEISFEADEGPSSSARELSAMPQPGYVCFRQAKLRRFDPLALTEGDDIVGMRVKFGTSGERVCFPLLQMSDLVPSPLRKHHTDRAGTFESGSVHMLTSLYEVESFQVEIFTATGSHGECQFTYGDNETWLTLSGRQGQVYLAWDFVPMAAPETELDQERSDAWLVAIMTNRIIGLDAASSLGPSDVFVEIHMLDPGNTLGAEAVKTHKFRTMTRDPRDIFAESSQSVISPKYASGQNKMPRSTLLCFEMKSARNVLLGECTIDISSLYCVASANKTGVTVPLHCTAGKLFLDVILDVVQLSHAAAWIRDRDRGIRGPRMTSTLSQSEAIIEVIGAQKLRHAKGLLKASFSETNRPTNAQITRSQPHGGASNPEWEEENLTLDAEDIAHKRFVCESLLSKTGLVWLLTARLFANDKLLGASTWIELPRHKDLTQGRPILYKGRFAGLLEVTASEQVQSRENAEESLSLALSSASSSAHASGRGHDLPSSATTSASASASVRRRRRSSLACSDTQGDNFVFVRVLRIRRNRAESVVLHGRHEIAARIRVDQTWYMTHFCESMTPQSPTQVLVFQQRLGPYRLEGTALGFEAEIAIIESTSGKLEERVIGCAQFHFVAQHLHACSYKIPDTDMHIDLLVERFPSRGGAESPAIDLAESSLYEAVLNVPKEFDLSLETLVFSADAIIPCRPLQMALNNQVVCLGLGQPALRSSFESLRLTASQSDGTFIEATYEVHQNELRLLLSEAGTHSLPPVFTWSFQETRYASLLPMIESDDFFSLNVERVEGLPSTWRSCRVRLVLISAKGPSYDVAGICANVSLSEGSAFIAEEFHFERFGRVAPVGLRIVVLGDGDDPSLETYVPVRKLAQAHFQIKVSDQASVSFSREEHATPDAHVSPREKNNTQVMTDPQLEPFVAAFARFDPMRSGSIPAEVVAQLVGEVLAFLLSDRNEQDLALELALLDTNSDGVVTFDEYLAWVETKRPASSTPAMPPPKAAHHLNVRLSIRHVECSSQLNARIVAKALPSGAKDATSSATGPRMTWPTPAVLKIPCEKNLELFLVENHTGKIRARSSLLEPEQIPDTVLLHGAPIKVRIEVTCARGLRAADNVGFIASHIGRGCTASSDPYCVVRVGKLSKRTKSCKDTCDPKWNDSLEFDVDPSAYSSDQQNAFVAVQIEVRDKDTMSLRDDFLGSCEMHCTADLTQETLSLQGKGARGTLTLRAQITAFETAKLSMQSETVTDITVDVLDRAIAKRTAALNEALRYSDEADQMLSKIPAPFRATRTKLAVDLTPRPPQDGRRSLRKLIEAVNQAPAMPPSTLVKLHEEIQERIFAFSSEHFGYVRGRAQRPPANPREYDVLLQLSGRLREHMRHSKGICIVGELEALRTSPSTKNADVIMRELVSSEEALRAHISSQLSKMSSEFDPQEAHAKRLLSELTRRGDIPTAMDLEETVRMWTEERKQRDHSARRERELAEYIENKQGELGSALGRRRDHLHTSSRADVLYAQNLAGTRHDAIESLRKSLAQADDRAERASSAALKNRLGRLQSLETLLAKFEPPGSTELLAALHAAALDRETTPVTLVELTASLLYPAIMDAVLTAHELAVRFVYAGSPEMNDAKRFFRLLKRRMVRDHRKKVLYEAVCARLDALGGRNDVDAWTIMRASDLAKSFIVGGDAEDVDGESLSESARQQAIKLIKDSFLSRADLLRMGGILHVEANCSQHSLRASLDGNDLIVLAGDQASIADEHRVEIPPQSKAEGVLHLDLLPFDPQATHFTRIMYHLEDLMQRPGVALRGHFIAQELELKRVGQGLVRIEVILSASNPGLALQCFVQGSFPIPGFITREHDMSCTWDLSSSSHEVKDLFFPGRDCRATSNVEVFAALFDQKNMAQPLGCPVPLRLDMDSPQSIGEGIGVKLSFQPDDNLLDRIRKERAAVKMTALGRGFLARRGAQLLGTAEFNLQASGLVGKTGSVNPSMSAYCSVHYGDTKLAATNAAKRMGASPDFGQIRLPIYKGWDGALAFKVWEQASLVGQCELSAAQLAATQASTEVTLALCGGLRSKQGVGLQVHVVRARAKLNLAPPETMCSVRLLTSQRGQGNKRTTRPRPINTSSTVEWNEGFIYRDWKFGVEEELRFEICNSENEHVEVFTLRLEHVLSQQKHTEWLKCSSSQSSLLVKAWALEVLDDPDRCGNLKITDMKLFDTVTSHPQLQPHPRSLSGPCKVIVHVLEARDLGEDACRPKVRCELLPWGQARPLGCGETGRTWSDGSHARWTRSEMNKLELSYPGSDGRDPPAIGIELWNAEHEPIVGHASVPFHSFSDDMWINLNPRGRIRFRVKVDADEGRLASARRVEASMCVKPRLNASSSRTNSSELREEASDLMLLEELKMVSAEDLVQHVAQTPRLLKAQNELRRTALHQAVIMNQPKLAHILLEAGANLSAVDVQDKTPVDYARSADMLRALGILAPHSVLVSQRSQMQGLQTVLQHLSLRDKAFATAELVESQDTSQEEDDDDTSKEADTDGNDEEVLESEGLVRRSSPIDNQSGKNEVLPAAEEAMIELLYDVVEQANGPDEVFDLFDMDGNGWIDGDEFEGSMRELLSIQSAADDRLEIVRSLAKMLMPSKGRPCSRRRFAAFFKEHARGVRQSSARSDSSQLADHLAKILASTLSLSIHSTATSARNAVEDSTGEKFDIDVVRQAWLKTLAREEREFEDAIACFVRKARGESQKWPTTMELSVFAEAVVASRDSGEDSDSIEAPARFIERLCERLHIDEAEVPAREIVERMLVTNGRADEEIVTRANDHLLQSIVELVRREGHGGSVNDFRGISRRLFETLDGNGSGAVDRLEFSSGMRQLGVTDASAVQQLFDMVDVNHDGRASVEEFVLHIERFIYRKQAALDSVLATLRKRTSKPERTTASSSLANRPKVARERLASKLAWMQKKCAERDMIKGSRETEMCTRYFQRSDKALSTLHEVCWSALVIREDSGPKRSNRSFEEVRISCYDEMDELLILDTGKSLRLGADAIEMVWDSEARGTGGRGDGSLYGSAADPESLLVRVLAKLEACKARVHRSACRVQNLFRRNHELLKGRLAVAKQRQHVQRVRDERKGATSMQRIVRGRQARKRKARLQMLARRQAERREAEFRAAQRIQAVVRGYMKRNDVMERREARRLAAVVQIQSCARGFLLRSAERRLTQREHDFIIRAVQTPFRKGFMAQLTIDAPRLAQEVLRMKLIMSPASEETTTQLPIYGLAVEAQQSAKSNVDVEARMQALRKMLRSFGVVDLESEVKLSCFRDKRGQTGVAEVLEKVILLDDEAMLMQTALDLAQEITNMHPVHDVTQVSAATMRVMSENPGPTDGPKDNVKARTGTAMFKSFRYLQDNAARSFAWVQTKAKTSNRVYTRSLELESFQGTRANDREDAMLEQVRALALVSGQFDAYGLMRALLDGSVSVDAVQDAEATLTAQWNGVEYQICARLAFAKKRKVTAGKGYNHVPARPLCKHADLHSVLMVSRGSAAHHLTDSSLQQQTNGASMDPQVLRVDFSELEMGERSAKVLQRAVWMPPAKTKVFAQRVYLHQSDVAHSGQGNGGLRLARAGFRRVRWIGKLVTSSETSEQVEVDAWRLTEQSTGGLQLRLVIPGGHLGWFSIQECKSMLRLCLRVDVGPDDMFERTSKILSPFEETGRLLTGLLGHIRERVRDVGDARRVFLRHGFETSMPRGALEDVLKRRLECLSYLRSVEGVLDAEEAEEVMGIFLDLFPDPLTLEAWEGLCEPPIIDTLTWISRALHSRPGGLVYMRAKFRSLGDGESLALEQVESALCEYLGDVGLAPEMLREVDWTSVSVDGCISVQALLHQLDTAHTAMRMSKGEAISPSTGMEPGTGDEAFPQEVDDEADEGDLEGGAQGETEELVTPAQRERLVQELVDSDDEEELWGSAFFRDEAMRSALAELRFRILEYANPDVHPDRFDLEKTFRVFDQDRTGLVDADEFRKALQALHMNQLLPTQEMIVRFIDAMDGDGDGKINLAEFKRMVGPQRPLGLLRRLRRPHALQTIRWSVELFVADLGEWIPGTAVRYRAFDNAIQIELQAHGKQIEMQNIGFLQIDDYPLFLRRNLWSGKPWGREPLWKRVRSARSMRNSKSVLEEVFSRSSKSASLFSSSSLGTLTTASSETPPTTARSSASSFASMSSSLTD